MESKTRPALTKGATLVDLVKRARGNLEAMTKLLSPEVGAFLDTRVLAGSWYPEAYLRDILVAVDRVEGRGDLALCRVLGQYSARKDLQGVYQSLLIAGDPLATIRALPTIWSFYHDTGEARVESSRAGEAVMSLSGHGLPNPALCRTVEGWIAEAVALAGGAEAEVQETTCRNRGGEICSYRVRWT